MKQGPGAAEAGSGLPVWWSVAFLVLSSALTAAFLGGALQGSGRVLYLAVAALAVGAVGVGVARNRPATRAPWVALGVGIALLSLGDIGHVGATGSWPVVSLAWMLIDTGPFAGLAVVAYALLRELRLADRRTFIDAGIVAVAVALVIWYGVVDLDLRVASSAYVILAIVSTTIVVGIVVALLPFTWRRENRSVSLGLLIAAFVALGVAELSTGLAAASGERAARGVYDAIALLSYGALGGAALHPSMRSFRQTALPRQDARPDRLRTMMVTLALLVGPGIVLLSSVGQLQVTSLAFAAAGSAIIVLLSVARFRGVVADLEVRDRALADNQRVLVEAQGIAHIGSWERDLTTDTFTVSDELLRIIGVERAAFDGSLEAVLATIHPEDRGRAVRTAVAPNPGRLPPLEYRIVRPDGSTRVVREESEVIRYPKDQSVRYVGSMQDITERVAVDAARTRLAAAVEQAPNSVILFDAAGDVVYVNPAFSHVYGYSAEDIVGRQADILGAGREPDSYWASIYDTARSGTPWSGRITNQHKNGSVVVVESVIAALRDDQGRITGYVQTDRDVTRELALEAELKREARERAFIQAALERIDPSASVEEISRAACLELARLPGVVSSFAVEFVDGRAQVLASEGEGKVVPAGELLPHARAAELIDRASAGPWVANWRPRPEYGSFGEQIELSGTRGQAFAPLRGPHGVIGVLALGASETVEAAGLVERLPALSTFASLLSALIAPKIEARRLEGHARDEIRSILDTGAFTPHFQPIVDLRSGAVTGYEALTRFADGRPPDVVFRLAERSLLGQELEVETIRAALGAAASALPSAAYLSLNVSPALLASGELRGLLEARGRHVVLELTERDEIHDYGAVRRSLKPLGPDVRLAVDDAGAGYASMLHIAELRPDFVKIDIGLVRRINRNVARQAIIAGIGHFAARRKVTLIAEGIETAAELSTLRDLGVTHGQGHLLGRPQDGNGPGPWPTAVDVASAGGAAS